MVPVVESKATAITFGPAHFLNRELSWLEINHRVLEEALDPHNPLLERVKFFCIVSSNLDEFFEVRVAGLKQQIESEVVERTMDGLTASETLRAIVKRARQMARSKASFATCCARWGNKAPVSALRGSSQFRLPRTCVSLLKRCEPNRLTP